MEEKVVRHEHNIHSLPICSTQDEDISAILGKGILTYFRFLKFNIFQYGLLLIAAYILDGKNFEATIKGLVVSRGDFNTTLTDLEVQLPVKLINIGLISFGLLTIFIYSLMPNSPARTLTDGSTFQDSPTYNNLTSPTPGYNDGKLNKEIKVDIKIIDPEDIHLGNDVTYNQDCTDENTDFIAKYLRENCTRCQLNALRIILYLAIVGLAIAYYYLQVALHQWITDDYISNEFEFEFKITLTRSINSLIYIVVDGLWRLVCTLATSFEAHKYFSQHVLSDCCKAYPFRIILFIIFISVDSNEASRMTSMLNLLFFNSLLSPLGDLVLTRILKCFTNVPFYLADEYTQVLFRQFLVYQCLNTISCAPLFGLIGSLGEYWFDKYRIFRLVKRPERHTQKQLIFILVCMVINFLSIFLGYPNGILVRLI